MKHFHAEILRFLVTLKIKATVFFLAQRLGLAAKVRQDPRDELGPPQGPPQGRHCHKKRETR